MTRRTSARLALTMVPLLALAQPAAAGDPVVDPMRPNMGPTATAPGQAEREMRRDLDTKIPTLTQRFGLPPVSGPLPAPQPRTTPLLVDPGPGALPPPRPERARAARESEE